MEQQHESDLVKRLEQLGIEVDVSPTVTTLTYEQIYTSGPTLEEALITFLGEALSRYEALRKWQANTMPIVSDWSDKHETPNLRDPKRDVATSCIPFCWLPRGNKTVPKTRVPNSLTVAPVEAHRYVETEHKKVNIVITVEQNNHCIGYLARPFLNMRREQRFSIVLFSNFLKVYASIFDFL